MEKHKPIFYTKKRQLLIILCILAQGFLQVGCSEDLYVDDATFNSKGIKISKVSLKEPRFQNKTKLIQEVNKIKNQQVLASNTNRMVYDSLNNFYFDDENGMLIENINGYESYTFKVIREAPIDSKLENVIFSKNQESSYDTYLVKYAFSEEEFKNLTQQQIENSPKIFSEIVTNNNGNSQIFSKCTAYIDCITIASPRDDGDPDGPNAIEICTYRLEGCGGGNEGSGSGSGSGTGGDSSGSSGGYGSSGSGNGSGGSGGGISTTPTPGGGGAQTFPNTPCGNLKKHLSTTTGIKLKSPEVYPFLKTKVNQPNEYGFYFSKENNVYVKNESYNATTNKITIKVGPNIFCSIHTHPYPKGNPMFSWEDVYTLQQTFQEVNTELEEEVTIFIAVKDGYGTDQLYALKVDDFSVLSDFLTNDIANTVKPNHLNGLTTDEERAKEILKRMNAKQHKYNLENQNMNQEVPFLKYFAGAEVSLYKANSTLTNWDKLTLSNNPADPITKTPCN